MSMESAKQWIVKLNENGKLRQQAESANNFNEWLNLAASEGFEFSKEEIEKAITTASGELSDNDLDSVAGGTSVSGSSLNIPGLSIGGRMGTGVDMNMDDMDIK